ncbi:helix-turn-helix domain-containing protein [Oceanobacter mangrovi]|uniref:helix-turn-helix domain-containing protein n=1 Tax=Oceanobacter mangrovi TaxID=2862510 RepID=UPI001C8DD058|nr:helix-turn-helix domain-containing protein [Oceanobacter mangrovi]
MNVTLDTNQVKGFDYWHEVICRTYAPCLGIADNTDQFRATLNVSDLGSLKISQIQTSAIRYERRLEDLKLDHQDDIFLSLMESGSGHFRQDGNTVHHQSGDVLVYDSGKPYQFDYASEYQSTLLRVPRSLMQSRLNNVDNIGGLILPGNSAFGALVASLIRQNGLLANSAELKDGAALSAPMMDMIATSILQSTQGSFDRSTPQQDLLERIRSYIKANLTDDSMTLEQIASSHNISVRSLSRLFAQHNETPRGWLQAQRLAHAYNALATGQVRNVTEAALSAGYRDLSHFSRSFKKTYGKTPNSLL